MPITSDTISSIFTACQNDCQQITTAVREEFFKPELDREAVKIWLELPLQMREAITENNPKLASSMNQKLENLKKGGNNNEL